MPWTHSGGYHAGRRLRMEMSRNDSVLPVAGSNRRRRAGVHAAWGIAIVLLAVSQAWALDPNRRISQYGHTAWSTRDGYFGGAPYAIAQTLDGYVWIATQAGLTRFDGARFVPWSPPDGQRLPSLAISTLLAARDGSLWIGSEGHLSHWADGHLTDYPARGFVAAILERRNGEIWFGSDRRTAGLRAVCRVDHGDVQCPEGLDDMEDVSALAEDGDGNLWIGDDTRLARWSPRASERFNPPVLRHNASMYGVSGIVPALDGSVWVGMSVPGGLQRLVDGAWKPLDSPELKDSHLTVTALFRDRLGDFWVGTYDQGLYRIHGHSADHFGRADGLSGEHVIQFYEDRERTLWVVTSKGVDRFRDLAVVSYSKPEGLGTEEVDSVLAARDGTVWIGGALALDVLRDGAVSSFRPSRGLPGAQVTALLEDHAGSLWVGIDDTLAVFQNGRFERIDMPDGSRIGFVVGLAEDVDHNVWAEITTKPRKLIRIEGRRVVEVHPDPEVPASRVVAPSFEGGIWLGLADGRLARWREGRLESFSFRAGATPPGDYFPIKQLISADGRLLGATTFGLIGWSNGTKRILTVRNGLPCDRILALVTDMGGDLWLQTQCGLVRIAASDLRKWWGDERVQVQPTVFDTFDGWQPGEPPFQNSAVRSPDGRLWFANRGVLQMVDPNLLPRNTLPPPVHIEDVVADRKSYPPGALQLPPLTRDLEIRYTALSLVVPQKVRFRYRLEGRDHDWVDAATRRQAFYTDLSPGDYRFRVIASNNDGVWNEDGATLAFTIAPAWFQTRLFFVAMGIAVLLMATTLYRMRVRQLARTLKARFDERLAERTRVARDIHDTLLQTVHGSKLVADHALKNTSDHGQVVRALEQLAGWLAQANDEGRATVNSLRTSTSEHDDLVNAFQRALDECRGCANIDVSLSVVGKGRDLHPVVRDEIYRIGQEAIRNACRHSRGRAVDVTLEFAPDLTLRIQDNGVGMDPALLEQGKDGHFGLRGMRERAARIGGRFAIDTAARFGTAVTLIVPGRVAFTTAAGPGSAPAQDSVDTDLSY